ncbi:hypothetical protein C4M76_22855 [Escherichia coli]|nr:hypothetical protein C4M76_22855 [Escherichia coli]
MTTLTDKELIKEIKERISSLDVRDNIERRAYEIALASLEADPVAYIFKHPAGKLFWALTDESNKEQPDVIPVYAAAPASVVPDNASEPLAYAYKELTPEIMRNQAAESNRGNEWTGNPDIDNAIIMLGIDTAESYDDDRIEAVKAVLRRLAGNSPVTPDGWISCSERMPDKLIPVMVMYEDGEMWSAMWNGNRWDDGTEYPDPHSVTHWREMPAAPKQELTVANLQLAVKGEYFDAMIRGEKTEEYRLCNDYWNKRIMFREYGRLIITKGYPKRDDFSRRIDVPYDGYEIKTITHPHFGDKPVKVFAIKVNIGNE